jgi:hypothetical protein
MRMEDSDSEASFAFIISGAELLNPIEVLLRSRK